MLLYLTLLWQGTALFFEEFAGSVTTGSNSVINGPVLNATFNEPVAIAIDSDKHRAYVADKTRIRMITLPTPDFQEHLSGSNQQLLRSGNYIEDRQTCAAACSQAYAASTMWSRPLCVATCSGCWVAQLESVGTLCQAGIWMPFVKSLTLGSSTTTQIDGGFSQVTFIEIFGVTWDADRSLLYIADRTSSPGWSIRKLDPVARNVYTMPLTGVSGAGIRSLVYHSDVIYCTVQEEHAVLAILLSGDPVVGLVTHLTGNRDTPGTPAPWATRQGVPVYPLFSNPDGLVMDLAANQLLVADTTNQRVRAVDLGKAWDTQLCSVVYRQFPDTHCGPFIESCGNICKSTQAQIESVCGSDCLGWQSFADGPYIRFVEITVSTSHDEGPFFDPWLAISETDSSKCFKQAGVGTVGWKTCATPVSLGCTGGCGECAGSCTTDTDCQGALRCFVRTGDTDYTLLHKAACIEGALSSHSNPGEVNVCYNPRGTVTEVAFPNLQSPKKLGLDPVSRVLYATKPGNVVASLDLNDSNPTTVLAEFASEPRGLAVNDVTGVLYGVSYQSVVGGPPGFMGVGTVHRSCSVTMQVDCGSGRYCDGSKCVACSMQGGSTYTCRSDQWRSGEFCDGTSNEDQLCTLCSNFAPYNCQSGQYRDGVKCNGKGTQDQTCADCGNSDDLRAYVCRVGFHQTGWACSGASTNDTQTCQVCEHTDPSFTYRCPSGSYRDGIGCSGASSVDTQTCALCNGGAPYNCPTNYHRTGVHCEGISNNDEQTCGDTEVAISRNGVQMALDVAFTIAPDDRLLINMTVGRQYDAERRKILRFGPIECLEVIDQTTLGLDFPVFVTFECVVPFAIGRDLPLSIDIDDDVKKVLWDRPAWKVSFPPPSLTPGSLRLATNPTIAEPWGPARELLVDPPGSVRVQFDVQNFYASADELEVVFVAPGADLRRCEIDVVDSTNVKCTLEYLSGFIQPLTFTVSVGPRNFVYVLESEDTLRYPATPDLVASAGCATTPTLADPWTVGCNTAGGDIITLLGKRLWLGDDATVSIVIEGSGIYPRTNQVNMTDVAHTFSGFNLTGLEAVTLQLQPGQGLTMAMTAGDGTYVSGSGPYLSYNVPNITEVICDCPGQGGVEECLRGGGNELTLRGSDFGADEPTVHVGCSKCAINSFSHKEIKCTMPFGKERDLVPQVTQAGLGGFSFASSTISYSPCSAGTYVNVHDCLPCEPGTFSATSEAIICQTCPHGRVSDYSASECQQCPAGTRVLANATGCVSCGPGFHSASGSRSCAPCPLGRASNATEAETCPRCDLGTYQGLAGKTSCLNCPPGKYTSSAEGTVCQNCLSGYIASTAGSDHCEPCAPGKKARLGQTCESCEAGTFSGNAAPECEPCIPGTVSDEAATSCTACPTGTNSSDSASFCVPCAPGHFARVPGSTECVPCGPGTYSTGQAANCLTCLPGHFSQEAASECTRCPPGTSSAIDGAASCSECGRSFFAPSNGSEYCTACVSQSSADENRTKCLCDAGAYLSEGANSCVSCHVGGDCKTAGISQQTLSPKAGWSASLNQEDENVFIACPRPSSCLAGGGCAVGYEGPLCASCQHGFGKRGKFECGTCTSQVLRVLSLVGLGLLALALGVFMVWKTRRGALESRGHFSVVLKVLFSAMQFNGMAAVIEFNWVEQLGVLVGIVNVSNDVATLGSSFISMECLLAEQRKGLGPFQAKSLVFLFAPLLIPLLAAPLVVSIVLLQQRCGRASDGDIAEDAAIEKEEQEERQQKQQQVEEEEPDSANTTADVTHASPRTEGEDQSVAMGAGADEEAEEEEPELHMWKIAKDFFATACVVLLFVVHPSLTRTALQMFNCRLVTAPGPDQKAYLIDDMNMECWTADHYLWAFLVSTPMFVIYAVGIPAAYTLILCRNRTKFKQLRTARKYSFLYKGYTPNVYYWEAIIFTRKVLVGCIVVFWSDSPQMQGLMAIFLATTAAFAHIYVMPYESNIYNLLEFVALLMSCLTFLCGQMTFADPDSLWTHFFSVLAIASSIVLLLLSAYLLSGWVLGKICTKLKKGSSPGEHEVDGLGKGLEVASLTTFPTMQSFRGGVEGGGGVEMAPMETGDSAL